MRVSCSRSCWICAQTVSSARVAFSHAAASRSSLRDERLEPLLDVREAQRLALVLVLLLLLLEPLALRSELLEPRVLDVNRALGGGELFAHAFPLRARLLHRVLGLLEVSAATCAASQYACFEAGTELAQHALELLELDPVARDVRVELRDLLSVLCRSSLCRWIRSLRCCSDCSSRAISAPTCNSCPERR